MENKSLRIVHRKEHNELHLQLLPTQDETPQTFCKKISDTITQNKAFIVRATFFGRLAEKAAVIKELEKCMSGIDFPITWIEGNICNNSCIKINGVYIFAVSGIHVERLFKNDNITGTYFQTRDADYCYLGGLYSDADGTPYEQTSAILHQADNLLKKVNLKYDHTIRTWFYLDEVLDWYNDFNRARTIFYDLNDIFGKLVPASTGISGSNEKRSKIGFELNAIKPLNPNFSIERIKSPLQCSAESYGSAFSRAVRYSDGEYSCLTISGTASIDQNGYTIFQGDIRKQIEQSFKVAMALMDSQDFKPSDIVRSYVYFSDRSFCKEFIQSAESHFPVNFAFICSVNKICRSDLLFEIEMDFIKRNS